MQPAVGVVTMGHAIVDVLAPVEDALVAGFGLAKGTMTLVGPDRAEQIYAALGQTTTASGGSAANTAAGLASLGERAAFVGKVRDDALGDAFSRDIRAAGVDFTVPAGTDGPATGRCLVMVTPDAEKTMCTSLGIGDLLGPTDIDLGLVGSARVLYLEGYLCGQEHTDAAVGLAVGAAREAGTLVALSLSDPLWVELHGKDIAPLLERVDLLFANESEARCMARTDTVESAVEELAERCPLVVVTRGAAGSVVATGGDRFVVPAAEVRRVVDTTGAGDLFAAGYLYGAVRGWEPARSARLGAAVAAEVVSHMGARPLVPLASLVAGV